MADTITPEERSRQMARIRGKDTKPELAVRRMVHAMGYRYRLHRRDLPGKPDMTLSGRRKIIFVHGCFWHRHKGCRLASMPKSRKKYWKTKLEGNRLRDQRNRYALKRMGWDVLVVWECQIKNSAALEKRIKKFLDRE